MYLKFYSLREAPFGVTPDPAFLYLSASHKEALAALLYGIEKRKGFITITGEVGSGKTTVLRAFLAKINAERVKAVYLFNPELTFPELIRAIFGELGLGEPDPGLASAIGRLHHYLIENYRQGKHVVLIVDEAQRMPVETLERLRVLSNLETAKDKLLQIVLCGQPEFEEVLSTRALRQLRERVAIRANIRLLTRDESLGYVRHRLGRVSYGKTPAISPAALGRIVRYARGNPRTLNIVCDNALIAGYAEQARPVTAGIARQVIAGLGSRKKRIVFRWAAACAAALLMLLAASAALKTVHGNFSFEGAGGPASAPASVPASPEAPGAAYAQIVDDPQFPKPASLEAIPAQEGPTETASSVEAGQEEGSDPLALFAGCLALFPEDNVFVVRPLGWEFTGGSRQAKACTTSIQGIVSDSDPEDQPGQQDSSANSDVDTAPQEEKTETRHEWTVRPGDRLSLLLTRVYGHSDKGLIERVLRHNPHIRDANTILVGDTIVLPETDGTDETKGGDLAVSSP